MNLATLARYILKRNVVAFLWALRYGEGTQGDDGYRTMFGGKLFLGPDGVYDTFDDFADHPRIRTTMRLKKGGTLTSTAAGAYQFLERTWDGLVKQWGFRDFSPETQDLAAVALILGRKALDDVVAGRIDAAVMKCAKEWASLPGSPYGQPVVTMDEFKREYERAGGLYRDEETVEAVPVDPTPEPRLPPVEDRVPVPVEEIIRLPSSIPESLTVQEQAMPAPIITALAPVLIPKLIELVPQLARIFGSGSATSERNVAALEAVANIAKDSIGAKNEQELIEAIQADPEQAQTVKQSIERNYLQIEEAGGGGIEGAREFNIRVAQLRGEDGQHVPLMSQPAFIVSCVMLGLVVMMALIVMFPWELFIDGGRQVYTDEVRLIVVTAIIGTLSTVGAFWLGSSFASRQKDTTISALGTRATDRI